MILLKYFFVVIVRPPHSILIVAIFSSSLSASITTDYCFQTHSMIRADAIKSNIVRSLSCYLRFIY